MSQPTDGTPEDRDPVTHDTPDDRAPAAEAPDRSYGAPDDAGSPHADAPDAPGASTPAASTQDLGDEPDDADPDALDPADEAWLLATLRDLPDPPMPADVANRLEDVLARESALRAAAADAGSAGAASVPAGDSGEAVTPADVVPLPRRGLSRALPGLAAASVALLAIAVAVPLLNGSDDPSPTVAAAEDLSQPGEVMAAGVPASMAVAATGTDYVQDRLSDQVHDLLDATGLMALAADTGNGSVDTGNGSDGTEPQATPESSEDQGGAGGGSEGEAASDTDGATGGDTGADTDGATDGQPDDQTDDQAGGDATAEPEGQVAAPAPRGLVRQYGGSGFTASEEAMSDCVRGLAGDTATQALVVDRGRYQGEPAGIVVFSTDRQVAMVDVWIVRPGCDDTDPQVLLFLRTSARP